MIFFSLRCIYHIYCIFAAKNNPMIARTVYPKHQPSLNEWYKYIHEEANKWRYPISIPDSPRSLWHDRLIDMGFELIRYTDEDGCAEDMEYRLRLDADRTIVLNFGFCIWIQSKEKPEFHEVATFNDIIAFFFKHYTPYAKTNRHS